MARAEVPMGHAGIRLLMAMHTLSMAASVRMARGHASLLCLVSF